MRHYLASDSIAVSYTPVDAVSGDDGLSLSQPATCTVTDCFGDTVAEGAATPNSGVLGYALQLDDIRLGVYGAMWGAMIGSEARQWPIDVFGVTSRYILTLADIRSFDTAFANETKYPDAVIAAARDAIEEWLETNGQCAFRPKGRLDILSGSDKDTIALPSTDVRSLYEVRIDGTALTDTELADVVVGDGGLLYREDGWPQGVKNLAIHYEYGMEYPPGEIRRVGLLMAKEHIVPANNLPSRATAQVINDMVYRITVAGRDGDSGIPQVDAAMAQFGRKRPVFG